MNLAQIFTSLLQSIVHPAKLLMLKLPTPNTESCTRYILACTPSTQMQTTAQKLIMIKDWCTLNYKRNRII